MSSFIRTIERTLTRRRPTNYLGRGSKLGTRNPKDASLLARLARERK